MVIVNPNRKHIRSLISFWYDQVTNTNGSPFRANICCIIIFSCMIVSDYNWQQSGRQRISVNLLPFLVLDMSVVSYILMVWSRLVINARRARFPFFLLMFLFLRELRTGGIVNLWISPTSLFVPSMIYYIYFFIPSVLILTAHRRGNVLKETWSIY